MQNIITAVRGFYVNYKLGALPMRPKDELVIANTNAINQVVD